MPRGKPFLPGNASFPKSRADNESHVYASIDDPTMYGHLDKNQPAEVDNGAWSNGQQVDAYRLFTGPTDSVPAATDSSAEYSLDRREDSFQPFLSPPNTFNLQRPHSTLISQGSLGFEDRRMMDNVLNTFKSVGDINPIRLSADESRLQPQMDSDSDFYPEPEYEETMWGWGYDYVPTHQKLFNFIGRAEKPLAASLCMCAYKDNVFMYSFELMEKGHALSRRPSGHVACIFY